MLKLKDRLIFFPLVSQIMSNKKLKIMYQTYHCNLLNIVTRERGKMNTDVRGYRVLSGFEIIIGPQFPDGTQIFIINKPHLYSCKCEFLMGDKTFTQLVLQHTDLKSSQWKPMAFLTHWTVEQN